MASPASRRSTPSRGTPNGGRRVNGYHGSPSQQAMEDLGRVYASEQRSLKRKLDEQVSEQQRKHIRALDEGLQRHVRIRESAERQLELARLEREREQREKEEFEARQIEEARRRLERQEEDEKRRRIEEERTRQEDARRREALREQEEKEAKDRAAAQRQREEAERLKKEQEQREERDRKAREDAEAKQREETAQRERERTAQQSAPQQPPITNAHANGAQVSGAGGMPSGLTSTSNEIETVHQKYLDLHQRLKTMRKEVEAGVKQLGDEQKVQLSEWRRGIQQTVGMFGRKDDAETKQQNQVRMRIILKHLDAAARTSEPMIDCTQYMIEDRTPPGAPKEGPAQLLFLLNHVAKSVIKQFILEAGLEPEIGNPLSILAVTVFARPDYKFNGQSLIDIFWAKYHRHCPTLFGISGNEMTERGRERLGWMRYGEMLSAEQYYLGIRGLGVGFACVTLRSFANSQNDNSAPNWIFWQAMARLLNTPSDQVLPTHFDLLKAIIENNAQRMINVYSGAAIALIRQACIVFPAKHDMIASKDPAAKSKITGLRSLPQILQHKYGISL